MGIDCWHASKKGNVYVADLNLSSVEDERRSILGEEIEKKKGVSNADKKVWFDLKPRCRHVSVISHNSVFKKRLLINVAFYVWFALRAERATIRSTDHRQYDFSSTTITKVNWLVIAATQDYWTLVTFALVVGEPTNPLEKVAVGGESVAGCTVRTRLGRSKNGTSSKG